MGWVLRNAVRLLPDGEAKLTHILDVPAQRGALAHGEAEWTAEIAGEYLAVEGKGQPPAIAQLVERDRRRVRTVPAHHRTMGRSRIDDEALEDRCHRNGCGGTSRRQPAAITRTFGDRFDLSPFEAAPAQTGGPKRAHRRGPPCISPNPSQHSAPESGYVDSPTRVAPTASFSVALFMDSDTVPASGPCRDRRFWAA